MSRVFVGHSAKIFLQLESGQLMAFDNGAIGQIDVNQIFSSLNTINLHLSLITIPNSNRSNQLLGEIPPLSTTDQSSLAIIETQSERVIKLVTFKNKHIVFGCKQLIRSRSFTGTVTFYLFVVNHSNYQLNKRIGLTISASSSWHWSTIVILSAISLILVTSISVTTMNLCCYFFAGKKRSRFYHRDIDFTLSKHSVLHN